MKQRPDGSNGASMKPTALIDRGEIGRGAAITLIVEDEPVAAFEGQTVAAVLLAHGGVLRHTRYEGRPRGLFCGMGVCFDCVVEIDGVTERACMAKVRAGMRVRLPARFSGDPR